jgi:hypothetical protein
MQASCTDWTLHIFLGWKIKDVIFVTLRQWYTLSTIWSDHMKSIRSPRHLVHCTTYCLVGEGANIRCWHFYRRFPNGIHLSSAHMQIDCESREISWLISMFQKHACFGIDDQASRLGKHQSTSLISISKVMEQDHNFTPWFFAHVFCIAWIVGSC